MESAHLRKKNLEYIIQDKQIEDPKYIWDLFIEECKEEIINDLVKSGKLINKKSIKSFLVYTILNEIHKNDLYRNDKIKSNCNIFNTSNLFNIIWRDDYQEKIKEANKKLITYSIGDEHYKVFQYSNKEHISTGSLRIGGTKDEGPYSFIHSLRMAKYLKKEDSPRIAIDLALLHDVLEEIYKYRLNKLGESKEKYYDLLHKGKKKLIKVKKLREEIKSLEEKINYVPEIEEIRKLFPNEEEYSKMVIKFLRAITQREEETDERYISRLIESCENFYKKEGLINNFFYVPILVKLVDNIDNTRYFRELKLEQQLSRLDKNYLFLEKVSEIVKKHNIKDKLLLKEIKNLFEFSFRRIDSELAGYWADSVDPKIQVGGYAKPLNDFKIIHKQFTGLWKELYPQEEPPCIYFNILLNKNPESINHS